ncbi:MAG TPA: hypothetical protein PLF22_02945 [Pseudomonadales bacterium]|nr:hypothetical protein [Pseudomonadales bacterium]
MSNTNTTQQKKICCRRQFNFLLLAGFLSLGLFAPLHVHANSSLSAGFTSDTHTQPAVVAAGSAGFNDLLGKQLAADAFKTSALADGGFLMTNTVQTVSAHVSETGVVFDSIGNSAGKGGFGLAITQWGRDGAMQAANSSSLYRERDAVFHTHEGGIAEKFTNTGNGIRQDFIVPLRPQGNGTLHVQLQVDGGVATQKQDGAVIALASGRQLTYDRLVVTDSAGKTIPAHIQVAQNNALDVIVDDATAQYPLVIDPTVGDVNWVSMLGYAGTNDAVYAIATSGSNVYIGGSFVVAGTVVADIAKWDGSNWSAIGTGLNDIVSALAVDGGGNLYAGGRFTVVGGASIKYLAKWNGSSWSALGTGVNAPVKALLADNAGNLYVGGDFTTAGGSAANYIGRWDGAAWSTLSTGFNGSIQSLARDAGGNLYAGGQFTTAGGASASSIAKWNGSSWSALGSGMNLNGQVSALAVDSTGKLYAGGNFTTAGGITANAVAKWNGSSWSALGSGIYSSSGAWVMALAVDASNVYVGGVFSTAGGVAAKGIAAWNGSSWGNIGDTSGSVSALAFDSTGQLYVGGGFWSAGTVNASRIARWAGAIWSTVGTGSSNIYGISIYAMARDTAGNLYIGGSFDSINGVTATNIAKWNGSVWSALGAGANGPVYTIATDGSGNVYAGGNFTYAGGVNVDRIAKWNGSNWSTMGGFDSAPLAIVLDSSGNLYAGGGFTRVSVGGVVANGLARWNGGTSWTNLGTAGTTIYDIKTDNAGNVYVGGVFTNLASLPGANNIARCNGGSWSKLGTGTNAWVSALALDNSGNVYAVGSFSTAGGVTATRAAKWDGSSWSALGAGLASTPNVLAADNTGTVYAGGTPYIYKWNGTVWSTLGSGVNQSVETLLLDADSNLLVGGRFSVAGNKGAAGFAKWLIVDSDGDKWQNYEDAFPNNTAEWLDSDNDGIGNNADLDDDGDGVPDYIDADPINAAVHVEKSLTTNGVYKGSSIRESQQLQ